MQQRTVLRYLNPGLKVALADIRTVWLLEPVPVRLYPEVGRGKLVYRAHGSSRRLSHSQIKSGLVRKTTVVVEDVPDWL